MPFDESLDKVLLIDKVPADQEAHNRDIEFKMASYNGGVPKLRLTRVGYDGLHAKLGGMTRVEIERVRDKMTELLDKMTELLDVKIEEGAAAEGSSGGLLEGDKEESPSDEDIPF